MTLYDTALWFVVNKVNSVLFGHNSVWSAELEGIHFFEVLDHAWSKHYVQRGSYCKESSPTGKHAEVGREDGMGRSRKDEKELESMAHMGRLKSWASIWQNDWLAPAIGRPVLMKGWNLCSIASEGRHFREGRISVWHKNVSSSIWAAQWRCILPRR